MGAAQTEAVHEVVVQGFAELGASDPRCVTRSILLKDTYYAG